MKQSDFQTFGEMLVGVGDMYGKSVSQFAVNLYWNAMIDFDLAAVRKAFDRHVKNPDTGQFMPKPADLIRMIKGSTQDSSMLAWSKVDRAVRDVGPYQTVTFDDPVIHRVLSEMGGWIELCEKTDNDWPFVQREFENRYKGYAGRGEVPDHLPSLAGIADAHNVSEGFQSDEVTLIGDRRKALINYSSGSTGSGVLQVSKILPSAILQIENNTEAHRDTA